METKIQNTIESIEKHLKSFHGTAVSLEQSIKDYLEWMDLNLYAKRTKKIYRATLYRFLSFAKHRKYPWNDLFTRETIKRFQTISGVRQVPGVIGLARYLYEQGKIPAPIHPRPPSPLPDIYTDYLFYLKKNRQVPDATINRIRRVLCAFNDYCLRNGIRLQSLTIEHIDTFHAEFHKDFSRATCHVYRSYLRQFLKFLFGERRLLSKNLAPLVTGPPSFARSKPPKFLRKDEVEKLFAGLKYATISDLRTAAIIHLAYMLGLRPCEISSLTLDDIHFSKAELSLRCRKNNRPDRLPLPAAVIETIAAYLIGSRPKSKYRTLFLTLRPPYRSLSANAIGYHIRRHMRSIGLEASAYWLRHTYAQNLLEAGASIYEVKEMLGHDSIESTRKYLHIHIELMRKVLFDESL
jgi:integrase/recombinase XerD